MGIFQSVISIIKRGLGLGYIPRKYLIGATDSLVANVPASIAVGDLVRVTAFDSGGPKHRAVWECKSLSAALPSGAIAGDVTGNALGVLYVQRSGANYYQFENVSDRLSIIQWGARVDDTQDDLLYINAAIVATPEGRELNFDAGSSRQFRVSNYIPVLRNYINLRCAPGVTLYNTNVSAGYPSDGIRVGNGAAVEGEGGTNTIPYSYTVGVNAEGFTFKNCRIGIWYLYSRYFKAKNIAADSTAAVAIGNDGYDDCDNFELENITQLSWANRKGSQDFYIVGIYRAREFKVDGVYQLEGMTGPVNAASVDINESTGFSLDNVHVDQETETANGVSLSGCQHFTVNYTAKNCKSGFVTFPRNGITEMYGTVNGASIDCTNGVQVFASFTTFKDIVTKGCTTDLDLRTDAAKNWFDGCKFNPGGVAVINEEVSGGNNGINLQYWRNCVTGNTPLGIEGSTDGYFGGARTFFQASGISTVTNATGDATYYPLVGWTEVVDQHSDFNPTTGVFTAPVSGMYQFSGSVGIYNQAASGFTSAILAVLVGGAYYMIGGNIGTEDNQAAGSTVIPMTRGQTAQLVAQAAGGTKVATVGSYQAGAYFQGMMV